jgi:tetratricopeptide (TPR) repeat protein
VPPSRAETWARRLALPALLTTLVYLASLHSRLAAIAAVAGALLLLTAIFMVIPRMAHSAFERGDYARAEICYRVHRLFLANREARGAVDVSLAGCRLARSDFRGALAELGRVTPGTLGVAARAAWHNNRAYALARADGDHQGALADIDEAVRLRPDVVGFRHTRGVVLLALGRVDDAIAELDEVWQQTAGIAQPPLLEAERCYDLGVAWTRKGEAEYARDYFKRAQAVAPGSPWAQRSKRALSDQPSAVSSGAVPAES